MTSIRRWLLGWLIFGMLAASAAAAFAIFHTARREASELFDYELRTVALSLPTALSGAGSREPRAPDLGDLADDRIVIEIWSNDGALVYHSAQAPMFERLPPGFNTVPLVLGRKAVAGSVIGGIPETQEMLDFCGEHGITSDIEVIAIPEINAAYERMLASDVKYRFVIDMATLKP